MKESLFTAGTVATQLQRTDTKLLFIPVIFVILRVWDIVNDAISLYSQVHTPSGVSFTIRLLAVSNIMYFVVLCCHGYCCAVLCCHVDLNVIGFAKTVLNEKYTFE